MSDLMARPTSPSARGSATEPPPLATLPELLARQVEVRPDAVAASCAGARLTFGQLERRANRLAHLLRRAGVGPEVQVAVAMERGLDCLVALTAIVKAGGAYVPLDPDYPAQRLRYMVGACDVALLVAQRSLAETLPEMGVPRIDPAREAAALEALPATPPAVDLHLDNLVYVNFTSGSSGRPKPVGATHRGLARLIAEPGFVRLGPGETMLQFASLSFDATNLELWMPLVAGARVAIFPPGKPSLQELARGIVAGGVTTLHLTAGLFHQLIDAQPGLFDGLHQLLAGGDALSVPHVRRALERVRDRVVNCYGPTECTTLAAAHPMPTGDAAPELAASVPIGLPLPRTRLLLLGRDGGAVDGNGAEGELAIGGEALARGYLGRPADTAAAFVPDPRPQLPGERIYRSGDRARRRADGVYEFQGREDRQVKVRGYRVEPGEVEAALAGHPAVAVVAVLARRAAGDAGEKRLVAYLEADPAAVPVPALRAWLGERLPEWMVPAAFVHLARMPLDPNGKVDRRALAAIAPGGDRPGISADYVAPRTPLEEEVAAVFSRMLDIDEVGVDDDLFELGGHSLALTRIITRLRDLHAVEIPMGHLFAAPTVAAAAGWIEAHREAAGEAVPPPRREERGDEVPLSFPQARIWFLQKLDPESLAYNFQGVLRFRGRAGGGLDTEALRRSLERVVHRQEAFRTSFPSREGNPVQHIHPPSRLRLPRVDLTGLPAERREAEAWRRVRQVYCRPFDVERPPIVYWVLFRLVGGRGGGDDHMLLHHEHHLVHDGWSLHVFLEELVACYRAFAAGREPELAELPVQFADFALWQRRWDGSADYRRQLDYWRRQLAGDPPALELPLDHPRPAAQTFRGTVIRRFLPAATADALRAFARRRGASLYQTLLAAFFTLFHRYSGQTDFCIGSGIANRRFKELERVIGMVINTLVLRGDLSSRGGGELDFEALLERIVTTTRAAYAHQDVPFDRVVEAVRPSRDASRNPLFQVCFGFHDAPLADLGLPGVDLERNMALPNGSAKFDLNLTTSLPQEQSLGRDQGDAESGELEMLWELNTDLFAPATIERMIGHYGALLAAVVDDAARPLSALPMLGAAERRQVLDEWNDTASAYPRHGNLAELFRASARRHGERVALVDADGGETTYAELAARAEALAAALAARQVGPESLVGLYLDRSPQAVVALVAVALAGAAYLPLDPGYPDERLALLLADAAPRLLLTRAGLADGLASRPAAAGLPVVRVDEPLAEPAAAAVPRPALADNLAYLMYTSGSTGRPKGVAVTQRGVLRLVADPSYVDLRADDVVLQIAPLPFDASTGEIWCALAHGCRLELAPPGVIDTAELGRFVARRGVTRLWLTAGLFHQMVDGALDDLRGVRQILAGGDVVSPAHVRRVTAELPGCRMTACYGPTENTLFTTTCDLGADDALEHGVPLGAPISDTRVYVTGRHGEAVPIGAVGEICAAGDGLARGYFGRPSRTAESFVPDPFAAPGGRLYRTGDRGRWRLAGAGGAGRLEFRGRLDGQVKVRGYRIEPGEVESHLRACPGVGAAVVLALGDGADDKRLVGFVTAAAGEPPEPAALSAALARRLPSYMVPSSLVVLDALPLTANDKVDRRALAARAGEAAPRAAEYVAPRNEIEEVLVRIWGELVDVPRIGVHDDFFDLGGHSLHATRHMHRVRDLLDIELPVRTLYEAPTIEQLALRVEERLIAELEALSDEEVDHLVG